MKLPDYDIESNTTVFISGINFLNDGLNIFDVVFIIKFLTISMYFIKPLQIYSMWSNRSVFPEIKKLDL